MLAPGLMLSKISNRVTTDILYEIITVWVLSCILSPLILICRREIVGRLGSTLPPSFLNIFSSFVHNTLMLSHSAQWVGIDGSRSKFPLAVGAGDRFGPGTTSDLEASFPIQDVLENYIYYFQGVHEGIEPTHDVFSFYVSDGSSRSEIQSINITIEVKILEVGKLRPLATIPLPITR